MNVTVPIALYSWPLVVVALVGLMKPRRAVIVAVLFAWMFLPVAGFEIRGLPNYTKVTATMYGVLLGIALFDTTRLMRFRPTLMDLPMLVWCVVPVASCISNNIGGSLMSSLYGAAGQSFSQVMLWGVPWVVGRLYFSDLNGLRELAVGIVIGGLIYVPLCLYEVRMSPQLHNMVYGFHPHAFGQQIRFGGYRPMVFMQHGLAVGMWMTTASLVAVWLWRSGAVANLRGVSMAWLAAGLYGTSLLCKSLGAIALLAMGTGVVLASATLRTRLIVAIFLLSPPVYMITRTSGGWSGEWLVATAEVIDEERAKSLEGRMWNEDLYIEHVKSRPILGWTPWHFQVYNYQGDLITTSDGLWIIAFTQWGAVGLISLFGAHLLPVARFVRRCPAPLMMSAGMAAPFILGVTILLFTIDSLLNAMVNPIFTVAAGGLATLPLIGVSLSRQHPRYTPRPASLHALRAGETSWGAAGAARSDEPPDQPSQAESNHV